MDKVKCLVCGGEKERAKCKIVVLTEQERAHVPEPLDEYVYCTPCWKVLSDPAAGPSLISGIASHHLRRVGVSNADTLVANFRAELVSKATRRS